MLKIKIPYIKRSITKTDHYLNLLQTKWNQVCCCEAADAILNKDNNVLTCDTEDKTEVHSKKEV